MKMSPPTTPTLPTLPAGSVDWLLTDPALGFQATHGRHPVRLAPIDAPALAAALDSVSRPQEQRIWPGGGYPMLTGVLALIQGGCTIERLQVWFGSEQWNAQEQEQGWWLDRLAIRLPAGVTAEGAARFTAAAHALGTVWDRARVIERDGRLAVVLQFGPPAADLDADGVWEAPPA